MRVLRLPAIHHDANLVVLGGSIGTILIDAGTSWYQGLQVERIKGLLTVKASIEFCLRVNAIRVQEGRSIFQNLSLIALCMFIHKAKLL